MTDAAAMRDVVAQVVERLGRLVVVANAGIAPRARTVRALDTADFERILTVNVFGCGQFCVGSTFPEAVASDVTIRDSR